MSQANHEPLTVALQTGPQANEEALHEQSVYQCLEKKNQTNMPKFSMTLKLITQLIVNKSFLFFSVGWLVLVFFCKHASTLHLSGSMLSKELKALYNVQLSITTPK